MSLEQKKRNDLVAQYFYSCYPTKEDEVKQRIETVTSCKHEFVILKKGKMLGGFHSTDYEYIPNTVECVHCGCTNKFQEIEKLASMQPNYYIFPVGFKRQISLESEIFNSIFENNYGYKGRFDENTINLLSKETLETNHIGLLYQLAQSLEPGASNETLFTIMKQLNELETKLEKLRLREIEDTQDLLHRYTSKQGKKLILK